MCHKDLLRALSIFTLIFSFSLSAFGQDNADLVAKGKKLYRSNCAACHQLDGKLIGPPLGGMVARWAENGEYEGVSGEEWLIRWIKNWNDPVEAGHPLALELKEYSPSAMNLFPALSDDDINAILEYTTAGEVKTEEGEEVVGADCPSIDEVAAMAEGEVPSTMPILVFVLLVIVVVLWRMSVVLNRLVLKKRGEPIPIPVPIHKNRKLITTIVLVGCVYLGYVTVDGAIDLGRQQGYMPDQPIAFSHRLHACVNQIDCQYCHSGARQGKTSMIPSPNVCMNCHKAVTEGSTTGTSEISKIYDAIGFDPLTRQYIEDYEQKPIEWVRIHNLPDHVYFNHQQHVVAGEIECQTCHGPVEQMDVVYQHAPLSMGWCVNCHRDTEVKFAKNDYYDSYTKLHEKLKSGEMSKVTVEDIGGADCQKCHY